MDVLLGVDFAVAEKDRLYQIVKYKRDLFAHLQQRWKTSSTPPSTCCCAI